MKIISTIFATLMVILSLTIAVKAYEVDNTLYPLIIKDLNIISETQIEFNLYNPADKDFDYNTLNQYEIEFKDSTARKSFAHSALEDIYVIDKLEQGKTDKFTLPFTKYTKDNEKLSCNEPIDVSLFLKNGVRVASWIGIPKCQIKAPRPDGLLRLTESVAEFYDGTLRIRWELVNTDTVDNSALLKKSFASNKPVQTWYNTNDCPDLINGICMTEISSIFFSSENVFVTLEDNREDTMVTLILPITSTRKQITENAAVAKTTAPTPAVQTTTKDTATTTAATNTSDTLFEQDDEFVTVYTEKQSTKNKACQGAECAPLVGPDKVSKNWITRLLEWIDNLL